MITKNQRSAIRLQKVAQRKLKKTYKGLSPLQKRYVKAYERFLQFDKALARFWETAPRNNDGAVDWSLLDDSQLDYFHHIYTSKENSMRMMSRLEEDGVDGEKAISCWNQANCHSESY